MTTKFCRVPLWEAGRTLAAVAQGREPADTVIRDTRLINVCTGEILPHTDVAIRLGRIALVGDAGHCIGPETRVVDAGGRYLAPGFLDGHIHVESSMLTVREYARAVVPHGTVGIYMDPHEIANVLGLEGVSLMTEEAEGTPLKVMVTTPSCVPAVPGFEDTGACLEPEDIASTMPWDSVVGLGEMMNFPGILSGDERTHRIVAETLKAGKTVTGHYSLPETGAGLNAYVAAGIRCCHESTRPEDALAKMRLGMYAQLREGSAWHDLHKVARSVTEHEVDTRFACLVSDDAHPHTLAEQGHLDHILRRAVEEGIDVVTAIQMVTINCAQCFHMDDDLGSVTPGKCADMVLLEDLEGLKVRKVWIDGELAAEDGQMTAPPSPSPYRYPDRAKRTMNLGGPVTEERFAVSAAGRTQAPVRVIEVVPEKVGTFERRAVLTTVDGQFHADTQRDILKAAVLERHRGTGKTGLGFVTGFGIQEGAIASTVAHDAHNLLVVGADDRDMAVAANALAECGGGLVVVRGGAVLCRVALPVAGLMNDERTAEEMSREVAELGRAWEAIGCRMASPFMTMALLSLACLPELRLTDRGLVDCRTFRFVPLIVEEEA